MDQDDHGLGVGAAIDRFHRRDPPQHGRDRFRIPGDRWRGRLPRQFECRRSDGNRSQLRDRGKRDHAAEALPAETPVGTDAEEYRHLCRSNHRAGAHVFFIAGDQPEDRSAADDGGFRAYRSGHVDFALSASPASPTLQVTGRDIPLSSVNL